MRKKVDECPTCGHETFIDEDPMTPSEKKASEAGKLLMSSIQTSKVKGAKEAIEEVAYALSAAERRGFERAKRAFMAEYLKPGMFSSGAIMKLNYDDGELDP